MGPDIHPTRDARISDMALFTDNILSKLANRKPSNRRLVRRWTSEGDFPVTLGLSDGGTDEGDTLTAEVKNLSITGMLVRIRWGSDISAGSTVTVGEGDTTAICSVAHVHAVPGTDVQELGLHIEDMSDLFCRGLHESVSALREDQSSLLEPWSGDAGDTGDEPDEEPESDDA